nr:CatB-related O-acetyltransferase [Pseudarthrobacter phenanthrenivorans]
MYSLTLREILLKYFKVSVGSYSYGSLLNIGNADQYTEIENYVSIGPNVRRYGAAHPLEGASLHPLFYNPALGLVGEGEDVERTPCRIHHDAWIGANVTILPGCRHIGEGAVVGAGSVVTKDVPPFTIVAGNPARIVKARFPRARQDQILREAPWDLEPEQALNRLNYINLGMTASAE